MARFRYFTCYWSVEASAQMVFSQPLSSSVETLDTKMLFDPFEE